jgi:hypothetical protein
VGDRRSRRRARRDHQPHRGNLILAFGILSLVMPALCPPLGLPFAILAWIMGNHDQQKTQTGNMVPEGRDKTHAGKVCGIVGTMIDGLFSLGCMGGLFYYLGGITQQREGAAPRSRPRDGRRWRQTLEGSSAWLIAWTLGNRFAGSRASARWMIAANSPERSVRRAWIGTGACCKIMPTCSSVRSGKS